MCIRDRSYTRPENSACLAIGVTCPLLFGQDGAYLVLKRLVPSNHTKFRAVDKGVIHVMLSNVLSDGTRAKSLRVYLASGKCS